MQGLKLCIFVNLRTGQGVEETVARFLSEYGVANAARLYCFVLARYHTASRSSADSSGGGRSNRGRSCQTGCPTTGGGREPVCEQQPERPSNEVVILQWHITLLLVEAILRIAGLN